MFSAEGAILSFSLLVLLLSQGACQKSKDDSVELGERRTKAAAPTAKGEETPLENASTAPGGLISTESKNAAAKNGATSQAKALPKEDSGEAIFIVRCGDCHARQQLIGKNVADFHHSNHNETTKAFLSGTSGENLAKIATFLKN